MGRLTATSNPTDLKEIDRSRVAMTLTEISGVRRFALERLNLVGTGLPGTTMVFVIASAGNTSKRFSLGTVDSFDNKPQSLGELDSSQPLRFRVLLHAAADPKLLGSIESIRARDEAQGESLLPMEPAKLGERLWRLLIQDDGPILQFNSDVFPNALGAENFSPFGAFVLPEALRQVMQHICMEPECLSDEDSPFYIWSSWLESVGATQPPSEVSEDEDTKNKWCDEVVDCFCRKFSFASTLKITLLSGAGDRL
jgi:hypothetical protein